MNLSLFVVLLTWWYQHRRQEMETTRSRMIFERETVCIPDKEFYCDGGDDFGHPRVYYTMVDGQAVCNYCNRLYILEGYEK